MPRRRRIIARNDTAANWTLVNPILAEGEFGVETDTNQLKIGDGTTSWSALSYISGGGGGTSDHGALTGLADDDHTQYLNTTRGDARYPQLTNLNELVDDRVASLLVAGSNVTLLYNDASGTLTIASSGGGGAGNTYFPSGW